jgi:hypothetical protein
VGKARFFSIATAAIVALNLGAVTVSSADAAQRGGNGGSANCVAVSGGTVQNATALDVVADGGTSISDAGGGTGNLAADQGNNHDGNNNNNNNHHNNNNNHNNNRNHWSAEPLQSFEQRLLQTDTASAGNAGVATSSANGGAVSIGDVNSGGNAGNAISIGDTVCPGAAVAPSGGGGNAGGGNVNVSNAGNAGGGGRGGQVRALPSTGVGMAETGANGSLLLALGALGMIGLSLGSRLERRVSSVAGR